MACRLGWVALVFTALAACNDDVGHMRGEPPTCEEAAYKAAECQVAFTCGAYHAKGRYDEVLSACQKGLTPDCRRCLVIATCDQLRQGACEAWCDGNRTRVTYYADVAGGACKADGF